MSYQVFAAYYDRLTQEVDYRRRAHYFDQLIKQHIAVSRETILLDLACGTGSLSAEMAQLGYDVIGYAVGSDVQKYACKPNPVSLSGFC